MFALVRVTIRCSESDGAWCVVRLAEEITLHMMSPFGIGDLESDDLTRGQQSGRRGQQHNIIIIAIKIRISDLQLLSCSINPLHYLATTHPSWDRP